MTPARPLSLQTLDAAAATLGVSTRTLRRYISVGTLKGYRLGPRLLRVDPEEVAGLARQIPTADRPDAA